MILISILIEKKTIIKLVYEIKKKLVDIVYDVIFVDDNSDDGSIEIIKRLNKKEYNELNKDDYFFLYYAPKISD